VSTRIVNALSTDDVRIELVGEARAVTALGSRWVEFYDAVRPLQTWTDTPPVVAGWYWLRTLGGGDVRAVSVRMYGGRLCVGNTPLTSYYHAYEWCGPIPEPPP